MTQLIKRLWPEEEAQSLSEYALLLFLICLSAVTAMGSLATRINNAYSGASTHLTAASHSGSLAGGSLRYGAQIHTTTVSPFKNDNSLNPE
jgi:Flp pilus assembly pilin Flp